MFEFEEVDLAEVPEELLENEAGAGSAAFKTPELHRFSDPACLGFSGFRG